MFLLFFPLKNIMVVSSHLLKQILCQLQKQSEKFQLNLMTAMTLISDSAGCSDLSKFDRKHFCRFSEKLYINFILRSLKLHHFPFGFNVGGTFLNVISFSTMTRRIQEITLGFNDHGNCWPVDRNVQYSAISFSQT